MHDSELEQKSTAMRVGGAHLRQIKQHLRSFTRAGMAFEEIEAEAQRLIKSVGAQANFAMVPGYHWATCIMKNDELCHGIPQGKMVSAGDLLTIDIGLLWEGYNLDTTISFGVEPISDEVKHFLEVGEKSLRKAINKAKLGNSIYDISQAMQDVVERAGYGAVYQLTGHGIGKKLHDEPEVPCVAQRHQKRDMVYEGQTLAVEIMYTAGDPQVKVDSDGWTYRTTDGSLAGMFEETVLITKQGPEVLT